ncbi:MAG TPA: formyltransferase family protein [Gaiellaceae bacterium]|nr:formyltransferase family protein [Gaiellaceae bacterium]
MNVVILTVDDPLYLPAFHERILAERNDVAAIFVVPPLYKRQTPRDAALRYLRTFGPRATVSLVGRLVLAKLRRRSITGVARRHGVLCERVADVNAEEFLERLRDLGTDLIVSVSCPQLFKRPLIELPRRGCLNIHGAILPEYRGVLPSFWMLANGEARAGVSIFFVDERIDAGELCGQRTFEIRAGESLDALVRRSKAEAADLLLEVLRTIDDGSVTRTALDLGAGSYHSWPDRAAVRRFRTAGHTVW